MTRRPAISKISLIPFTEVGKGVGLAVDDPVGHVPNDANFRRKEAEIERAVGPIDILVNNAGIQRRQPLVEMSTERSRR